MKYCQSCGAQLLDAAEICPKCGVRCAKATSSEGDKPIKGNGAGFCLGFFLGILGLILGICLGDEEAKSGAGKGFCVGLILSICIVLIYACSVGTALDYYY